MTEKAERIALDGDHAQRRADAVVGGGWRNPAAILIPLVTIPVILIDQATKLLVKSHMTLYESIPIIRNFLDITYTENPGAAFSMLAEAPPWVRRTFLLSLSIVAIIALGVLLVRAARVSVTSVAFALIMGGAAGNMIDRALRGGLVIDFVRAHYYDLNYPVFNVADSAISIGVTLIILATLFGHEDDTRPSTPH
jgi:signal peptidase II